MMGGRLSPMMPHVSTTLWPTVTVVTLSFWSSGRMSWYTSEREREDRRGQVLCVTIYVHERFRVCVRPSHKKE